MVVKKKTLGLAAIAVYSGFCGVLCLFLGVILLLVGMSPNLKGLLFSVLGLLISTLGVMTLVGTYGLWTFQEWGRRLILWLFIISIPLGILFIFPIFPKQEFSIGNLVVQVVGIFVAGLIVHYLSKSKTKELYSA